MSIPLLVLLILFSPFLLGGMVNYRRGTFLDYMDFARFQSLISCFVSHVNVIIPTAPKGSETA